MKNLKSVMCSECGCDIPQRWLADYQTSKVTSKPICDTCNMIERHELGMANLPLPVRSNNG